MNVCLNLLAISPKIGPIHTKIKTNTQTFKKPIAREIASVRSAPLYIQEGAWTFFEAKKTQLHLPVE